MLDRLNQKIKSLYEILDKYNTLNKGTHGEFLWRIRGIEAQIDALEELRDNKSDNWRECYEEDVKGLGSL